MSQPNTYRIPDSPLSDIVDAPSTPMLSMCPNKKWLAFMGLPSHPPIKELAEPELRLAGIRINPRLNIRSRSGHFNSISFRRVDGGPELEVSGMPEGGRFQSLCWSRDGAHLAFVRLREGGSELWLISIEQMSARRLIDLPLNAVMCAPVRWCITNNRLICSLVPEGRQAPPSPDSLPIGPVIEENDGRKAPARTYQDLLSSLHDEMLFEYYGSSQLALVDLDGTVELLGDPGLFFRASQSPDGRFMIVGRVKRPFSYLVPMGRFPQQIDIWDMAGQTVHPFAELPLAEEIPIGFSAVRQGPRQIGWRSDKAATIKWVEALDGGDPERQVEFRDRLCVLDAPFEGESATLLEVAYRLSEVVWGDGELALVTEAWWKDRHMRVWIIAPDGDQVEPKLLFDRNWEDRYTSPGRPILEENEAGFGVLRVTEAGEIFMVGEGASEQGNRPFLDRLNLETRQTERLWRSAPPIFEQPIDFMDDEGLVLLTRRESTESPPNFYLRDLQSGGLEPITDFPHPTPELLGIQKDLIRYERKDGLPLTGTLFLPSGYDAERDGPLPTLLWAYPREFKSAAAAGQVRDSPHRFVRVGWWSPVLWVTRGYAVLSDPAMPIVGEGEVEPNDTYLEQLVAGASAAVETLVERGVADRARVAVGGHSYGAFMAANLLAHSDLFCAGIARSGAFNRTLTPFGFQAEERTLWQAPEAYFEMSPFVHADKIKAPLLLIHGAADNNSGTYPMQSERFYKALKGHGATTRLVMLPHESHGYRAWESIMHMVWEMDTWLSRHTKGR